MKGKVRNIAVVGWQASSFTEDVISGFEEGMARQVNSEIDLYYVENKLAAGGVLSEVIERRYDLIVTIGAMLSQEVKNLSEKRKSTTPVLFVGVVDPAKIGIVESEEKPGGMLTGITLDNMTRESLVEILLMIKPKMKSVLLPWSVGDNGGTIENDVEEAKKTFLKNGVKVHQIVANGVGDFYQKVVPFCSKVDSIILLPGTQASIEPGVFVKLCNQHTITLMAYELSAASAGAAVAYGSFSQDVGAEAARMAAQIICEGKSPAAIPVNRMKDWCRIAVNPVAAKKQGLHLSDAQLFCLKNGMVISSD